MSSTPVTRSPQRHDTWLRRLERALLPLLGAADVGAATPPPPRSSDRLRGLGGRWRIQRSRGGRSYLVTC